MLSGYLLSIHNLLSTLLSVTWVPLVIFLYLRAIKRGLSFYALLAGIALCVLFTGGGIEVVFGTVGLLIFLALLPDTLLNLSSLEREDGSKAPLAVTKRAAYLFLSIITFLLLSAIQLSPFLELSQHSIRADGLSYAEATTWSMDLKDIWQFFIPDPYGYGASEEKYWSNQSWLKTIYLGTIPFILSIFFFIEKGRRLLPFMLLLPLSFAISLGKNTSIYEYLYYYLPFFNKIRYPVKFLFLVFILLSISAGFGWDSLKQGLEQGRKGWKWIILGLLLFATLAAIAFGLLSYFDSEVKAFLIEKGIKYPEYNDVNINLHNTKRLLVIFIITVLVLYSGLRSVKVRKALPYLMVSLLTIDLFFAHNTYYITAKGGDYHKASESMEFIGKDKELFRIFVTPKTKRRSAIEPPTGDNLQNTSYYGFGLEKEKIHGYNLERRIFDVEGSDVIRRPDYERILALLNTAPRADATNLLALLNVKYVLSIPKIESKEFRLVKIIGVKDDKDRNALEDEGVLKIYENLNYLPRAFLVEKYRVLTIEEDYHKTLQDKTFHPRNEVLLYEEPWEGVMSLRGVSSPKQSPHPPFNKGGLRGDFEIASPLARNDPDGVTITEYKNNSVKLDVVLSMPKILVMSDVYYPGWKVYIDEREGRIFKANYVFRAVPLEEGKHDVRFIYDPLSFKLGMIITLTTIVGLLVLGVVEIKRLL